jgi:hypothetical protein
MDFFAGKNAHTAYDMVNLLPGFTFSNGDNTIRGYTAAVGNVIIDGERVSNKQLALDSVLQHIPASQVEYVEVIQGSKPGTDMLGQTMIANVVRRQLAGTKVVVTLSNASFEDRRNAPGGTIEVTNHWSGGRSLSSAISVNKYVELAEGNGTDVKTDTAGRHTPTQVTSAAGGLNAYAYSAYAMPAWRGVLSITGSAARTDYNYSEIDDSNWPSPSTTLLNEHLGGPSGGQLRSEIGAHFNRDLGRKWSSESVVLVSYTGQTYSSVLGTASAEQRFFEKEHLGEGLVRTSLRFTPKQAWTFEFSGEGAYNWLRTSSTYSYDAVAVPLPNARARVAETRGQTGGNMIWSKSKRLQLEAGIQLEASLISAVADVSQEKPLTFYKPRFVVNLTPDARNHLRARVEREVSQLNFADFVASSSLNTGSVRSGNTAIVPQQDWVVEGLYERHFWSESDVVFTYRHHSLTDVLDRVALANPSRPMQFFDAAGNIGKGTEDTAIVSFTSSLDRIGVRRTQVKGMVARQFSRATDPVTGSSRSISAVHPLEYSLDFRRDLPRWHGNWGGSISTPCAKSSAIKGCSQTTYRFNEIDVYRASPALSVFAERHIGDGWLLRIEGNNLLRQRYGRTISTFSGSRNLAPVSTVDSRELASFLSVSVSVRREF